MAVLRQLAGYYPISGFAALDNKRHPANNWHKQPLITLVLKHLGWLHETRGILDLPEKLPAKAEKVPLQNGSVAARVTANSEE